MPELPEVETIARDLRPHLSGRRIVAVRASRLLRCVPTAARRESFPRCLVGRTVKGVGRRGKYLLIALDDGRELMVHLGMTGRLVLEPAEAPADKHMHLELRLAGLAEVLRFIDARRFGRVSLGSRAQLERSCGLGKLGIEPLESTARAVAAAIRSRPKRLKALLLEQSAVAGAGNIYADEALFRARLHPERVASELSEGEALALARHLQAVLREAIRRRGSSVDDYVDGSGAPGSFQKYHRAYGREGRPCRNCRTRIVRLQIAGRSTHICPRCQRAPKASRLAKPLRRS